MDTQVKEIYTPKYEGERFLEHRLPLDLLEELSILRGMTIEMAKRIYFEKNPGRKRIPRNFNDGISIELEQLEPGSTIAKIILVTALSGLFPVTNHQYFEEAPKRIINAIAAVKNQDTIQNHIPKEVLVYFEKFGKNLQDNEQINFTPYASKPVLYTKEVRKQLILASSKSKQYTDNFSLRGKIIALDKDRKIFELQTAFGKNFKGIYPMNLLKIFQEAFVKLETGQKVLLSGTGNFRSDDQLQSIQEIEDIMLLDDFDVPARLEELSQLQEGWLDGEQGIPFPDEGLKWLSETFDRNYNAEDLPLPATFPTPEGNIHLEWSINEHEVTVEINLRSKEAEYHAIHLATDKEVNEKLNLADDSGWSKLNVNIQEILL